MANSNPILFASGSFFGLSNVSVVEEAQKITQVVVPSSKEFRFSSSYRSASAPQLFLEPRTQSLNGGYELSKTSVAMLIAD